MCGCQADRAHRMGSASRLRREPGEAERCYSSVGSGVVTTEEVRPAQPQDREGQHPEGQTAKVQAADLDTGLELVAVATAP